MATKRIMIVDDDVDLSRTLKLGLQQAGGYEVAVTNEPAQAQRLALDFRPHIILLDVIMPDIDGGTLASQLREDETLRDIPVIFLTSILGRDEAAAHGGRIGHDPVLAKPVSLGELTDRIERSLREVEERQ